MTARRFLLDSGLSWTSKTDSGQVMPDDHSELEPPLPIPNRTVKRYRADDSAETSVKVGYRQAIIYKAPDKAQGLFFYFLKKLKKVEKSCDEGLDRV